jgi:hypothetical protein
VTARLGGKAARRILGMRQHWGLSFAEADWRKTVLWRSRSPKVPRGRSWADPFLVARDGRTYCFVEDYVQRTGRGHITALKVGKDGVEELGPALVEPFHLSFPFVFEYDGSFFMCPETQEARQIRIYRGTEFPLKWELAAIPMQDVSAVDTMLFSAGGSSSAASNPLIAIGLSAPTIFPQAAPLPSSITSPEASCANRSLLCARGSGTLRNAKCAGQSRVARREESPGFNGQRAG